MPAGDGRGPNGAGPMTGRGAGFCAGYSAPGYTNPVRGGGFQGFGYGRGGRGGGRGWRNRFNAAPNYGREFYGAPYPPQYPPYEYRAEDELRMLKEEANAINERIRELEAAAAAKTDK
ncbi:MAG TPA: DUF5320 domain-containing protein [Spirochaetota bacterium]|nr:DUF5320 domain-containing protein [Spirochaetota bacterium]